MCTTMKVPENTIQQLKTQTVKNDLDEKSMENNIETHADVRKHEEHDEMWSNVHEHHTCTRTCP